MFVHATFTTPNVGELRFKSGLSAKEAIDKLFQGIFQLDAKKKAPSDKLPDSNESLKQSRGSIDPEVADMQEIPPDVSFKFS